METPKTAGRISYFCYRVIRGLVQLFYPKITIEGLEQLPDEPCLLVANHCQMHGPIIAELYVPGKRSIWCAGQMMHLKDVPDYAYEDFWSHKPKAVQWFYRLLSYLIAPLSVCIFNHAHTIPVYRDSRILSTFRDSTNALCEGKHVVVFPECPQPYSNIVNQFQEGFVDIARLYYKRSGKKLLFVPMYNAPSLKKVYLGQPLRFCPENSKVQERERVSEYLMQELTALAAKLPLHTVIPYNNIAKKYYPTNKPTKDGGSDAKTSC